MQLIHKINNKFFNLDLNYLGKNSFYTLFSYSISILVTLVITYLIANYLDEHTTGIYRYVFSWYGIISIFTLGGMASAITISIAKKNDALLQALKYKALFSILGFFVTLILASYYFYKGSFEISYAFFALAISIPFLEISSVFSSYFQGKENFKSMAFFSIIGKVTALLFTTLAIFYFKTPASLIFAGILFVGLAQAIYSFKYYKFEKSKENKVIDTNLLNKSLHFSAMGILYTLGAQADKIILFTFFGSGALAAYWIATTIPLEIQRFATQISSIYFPKLVQKDSDDKIAHKAFKYKFLKIIFIFSFLLLLLSLLYYFLAPFIFQILFPKYLSSMFISQMFFFTIVFTPFLFIWQYFLAQGYIKINYFFHTIDPILQIILYFIFIYIFGIFGVIYAIFIKNFLMSIIAILILRKK